MEKTGISITRELMWWWGVRLATVPQLLELLRALQLYRAAQVILDCEYLCLPPVGICVLPEHQPQSRGSHWLRKPFAGSLMFKR